ncbi:MAG: RsmB/NOP family class I SAM-dependent RNA methyltransferase [Lautropia sp.]|nr:RsmB/NOP family class I SAM-dependent RNA methyltransferase [Lautropia sp.]
MSAPHRRRSPSGGRRGGGPRATGPRPSPQGGASAGSAQPGGLPALAADALAAVLPDDAGRATRLFDEGGAAWHAQAPADQRLGFWLRRHPGLGPRERRWISDRVYEVLRQGRAFEGFLPHRPLRAGAAGDAGCAAEARHFGQRCLSLIALADQVLGDQAGDFLAWRAQQPPAVRYSLPDWLWQQLQHSHGEGADALAARLLQPARVEIRANLLKTRVSALHAQLAQAGIEARPVDGVPTALRLPGRPALARLPLYEAGHFEVQDAGSQAIVEVCGARRGERVIDFCAGAGGKTLGLAARMRNQGQILAFDTDEARLGRLAPRLRRAGVDIVTTVRLDDSRDARLQRYRQWADLVLLDAPCSGSGTLRRHPDLKWRLQPADVLHYRQLQREIIAAALKLLRPGGRLVYATCSLLAEENTAQMQWLQQQLATGCEVCAGSGEGIGSDRGDESRTEPGAVHADATDGQRGRGDVLPVLRLADSRHWLPDDEGGDAFFMACWQPGPA